MIRIGIRENLFYPLMLLLFIFICRVDEIIMKTYFNYKMNYIFSAFIFIPQLFEALVLILSNYKKKKKTKKNKLAKANTIEYIENRISNIEAHDSKVKIGFLIFFDSFFNFTTVIIGKHYSILEDDKRVIDEFIEKRLRCMHILFSAILCYLTININIYKHQKLSLIVILIFLIVIILIEYFWLKTYIFVLLLFTFCFLIHSFLDTVEKYLFEVNYSNPYKILLWEGIFGNIFFIILSLLDRAPLIEIKSFINEEKTIKYYILIILLVIYLICSGFRSLYRIHTVQYFSPMARALFELILDPFIVVYKLLKSRQEIKNEINHSEIYSIIITACLLIISFFSLVYNDFIVLYCCGFEEHTFLEIKKRAISFDIDYGLADEEDLRILENSENSSELSSKRRF